MNMATILQCMMKNGKRIGTNEEEMGIDAEIEPLINSSCRFAVKHLMYIQDCNIIILDHVYSVLLCWLLNDWVQAAYDCEQLACKWHCSMRACHL